jgi:hypothetical protein
MGDGAPATLEGFKMTNCYSSTHGGAIYIENTAPTIRNCTFTDNCAFYGGAIGIVKEADVLFGGRIRQQSALRKHG